MESETAATGQPVSQKGSVDDNGRKQTAPNGRMGQAAEERISDGTTKADGLENEARNLGRSLGGVGSLYRGCEPPRLTTVKGNEDEACYSRARVQGASR